MSVQCKFEAHNQSFMRQLPHRWHAVCTAKMLPRRLAGRSGWLYGSLASEVLAAVSVTYRATWRVSDCVSLSAEILLQVPPRVFLTALLNGHLAQAMFMSRQVKNAHNAWWSALSCYHSRAFMRATIDLLSLRGFLPAFPLYALKRFLAEEHTGHL